MYICICNGITDRQIKVAIEKRAARSVSDMYRCLLCKPQCGRCAPTVVELMRQPELGHLLPEPTTPRPSMSDVAIHTGTRVPLADDQMAAMAVFAEAAE